MFSKLDYWSWIFFTRRVTRGCANSSKINQTHRHNVSMVDRKSAVLVHLVLLAFVFPWYIVRGQAQSQVDSQIEYEHAVKVYHFLINHWGQSQSGQIPCGKTFCEWVVNDHIKRLHENLVSFTPNVIFGAPTITVSLYNIHSWWERTRDTKPASCELKTNFTMAETEESFVRYSTLFDSSFKNFDGFSSTHPSAAVQRIYKDALFTKEDLLTPNNFSSLIKGASYIASDCHRRDSANARRDEVIGQIRSLGFRVDGLGRCMHSEGPEGVSLPKTRDTRYNLNLKRSVVGKFLFNMAFENSIEAGYVTEKPFDALIGGK